jgi:DNA-binding SARP family transcriptional activator
LPAWEIGFPGGNLGPCQAAESGRERRRGDSVEFRILGPLEVAVDSQRLELGGTRQQIVLATLLLSANGIVTVGRLQEAIYGADLPPTARSQAQIGISGLRHLFASHGHPDTIATRGQGYLLRVDDGQLDAQRFEELSGAARAAREAGQLDRAVASYRDALRLWRGPALAGIDSQLLQAAASRLDEQRISSNEDRIDLELDLGRQHELVGELTELVAEFPLRERPRGQLMLALYRCGRTAEALQAYRSARQTMIDELGIEPGERLQQLERAILTSDPAIAPPARPVRAQPPDRQVPCLLPAGIADFTGRAEEIEQIRRHLSQRAGEQARLAVPVAVIAGKGGVGKTCLAVHAAHGLAGQFPDGQLFADLHGGTPHSVGPAQVLERFLRVLEVPGQQIPDGLDERAEEYRNLLAGRRVLVVLDDAVSESQVQPLLPGSGTAAVIVTSRRRLAGLAGAHIEVDVFGAGESLDLLGHIAGAGRVRAQAGAATAVAEQCGHLPLALRVAGARLSARPHWSIQQLVDRLADETRRLDELRHGDLGIRASISLSYDGASEQAKRLFRRLALLETPVFPGWLTAALLDLPHADAEDLLDDLVSAQLVEAADSDSGGHGHYRFHELIRVFARERLAAEEPAAERQAALQRALGAWMYLVEQARIRHYESPYIQLRGEVPQWPLPGPLVDELLGDPLSWLDQERAALVTAVRQAAQAGLAGLCWGLALRGITIFEARAYFDDWRETHEVALAATRKAHLVRGQAAVLWSLSELHWSQSRLGLARQGFDEAARLFREVGDAEGLAVVIRDIASMDRLSGRLDAAARGYQQALPVFRAGGDRLAAAYVLHNLAQIHLERQDLGAAREALSEALQLSQGMGSRRIEAQVRHRMGEAELHAGEPAAAVREFDRALALVRDLRDPVGEAHVLVGSGVAKLRQGESAQARRALQRAAELAGGAGDRLAEARALVGLGQLALADGDPRQAVALGERAAATFQDIEAPFFESRALSMLSDARTALGETDAAATAAAAASALRSKLLQD